MRLISIAVLFALTLAARVSPTVPVPPAEVVAFGPLQPGSGWLLTEARLYVTGEDLTWQDVTPAREAFTFLAADFVDGTGWLVAARGDARDAAELALARTTNSGASWQWSSLSLSSAQHLALAVSDLDLDFENVEEGTLRVTYSSSSNFERWAEWRTVDGGKTWTLASRVDTGSSGSGAPETSDTIFLPGGIEGWQMERSGLCRPEGSNRTCERETALRITRDGGGTWREVPLPAGAKASEQFTVPGAPVAGAASPSGSRTMVAGGQGFDKCEVPTLDQLREWRWVSPYSSVNLYIGGALRACSNQALNADYVRSIYYTGWTFIPTWVGPQAPCTNFRSRISYDLATAQSQGWMEAQAAADALRWLGLTETDGRGSIAYYDMEAYNTGDGVCNAAVHSFVAGWTQGLHSRGHLSGVYGTGSTLRLFTSLPQPPDAIWAAHWIHGGYHPAATVWNVYNLGNDVWSNSQRIRQYTGGHWEAWGSVALNIDSNVLDGPVALAGAPLYTPTPTATATATVTPTPTRTRVPITPTAWVYLPLLVQP